MLNSVKDGDLDSLRRHLSAENFDVHRNLEGGTLLYHACIHNQVAAAECLLTHGANANSYYHSNEYDNDDGMTPLLVACRNANTALVKLLLENNAEISHHKSCGRSALFVGIKSGNTDIVQMLLANGATLSERCRDGLTPIAYAASNGHNAVIELLLSRGAKIFTKTKDGVTALLAASRTVEYLLAKGAYIDETDSRDNRALMLAVRNLHVDTVKLLIRNGADINRVPENRGNILVHLCEPHTWTCG